MNSLPKHKVEIFSPAEACSCSFSVWINNVWNILEDYRDKLEIISLTSDTDRAKKLGVSGRTVVVNGEIVPIFLLEQKLDELFA
ncbi:MAG: hypothetical protein ACFFAU_20685 [Candidatus Hodarchaeota archaeon]